MEAAIAEGLALIYDKTNSSWGRLIEVHAKERPVGRLPFSRATTERQTYAV